MAFNSIRARPGLMQQDIYGYGMNDSLTRRGLSGRASPVGLAGRLGIGGGLRLGDSLPIGLSSVVGGMGGAPLGGFGGVGINPLALNGVGALQALNGGLSGRGRLNPTLAGAAPLPIGNALAAVPRSAAFSPNTIPALSRGRGRGLLGGNNENHYVYPPASEMFSIPVSVLSTSGRRGNNILSRLGGLGGEVSEFILTIPSSATIADIFDELNKGRWDYNLASVYVYTVYGELFALEQLMGYDAMALWETEPQALIVEN